MSFFNEDTVEQAALEWLGELGYEVRNGLDIAPEAAAAQHDNLMIVTYDGDFDRTDLGRRTPQAIRQTLDSEPDST